MNLLVANFEVDEESGVLAWQASVIKELSVYCETVIVVTSRLGKFACPNNVHIYVVPKWVHGVPRRYGGNWLVNIDVAGLIRRHKIDACFIHMAMEWAYVLSPVLKFFNVPTLVWYAHGTVSTRLRLAHAMADRIVTSTPEGFRLPSNKVHVIGQGVDTDLFTIPPAAGDRSEILYVGRVSPRKQIHLLVQVMVEVKRMVPESPLRLRIIGPTLTADDSAYLHKVQAQIENLKLKEVVKLSGFVPHAEIAGYYQNAFLHLNLSKTGSMDKTVLEALACGCPVLTSNEAFGEIFQNHREFLVQSENPRDIAAQVLDLYRNRRLYDPDGLRGLIVGRHDLASYAGRIMRQLEEIQK